MATIRDIAKKVGFSESIVSRALNNNPQIKDSTRELITKAAQEMGYYPNVAARSLVNINFHFKKKIKQKPSAGKKICLMPELVVRNSTKQQIDKVHD